MLENEVARTRDVFASAVASAAYLGRHKAEQMAAAEQRADGQMAAAEQMAAAAADAAKMPPPKMPPGVFKSVGGAPGAAEDAVGGRPATRAAKPRAPSSTAGSSFSGEFG